MHMPHYDFKCILQMLFQEIQINSSTIYDQTGWYLHRDSCKISGPLAQLCAYDKTRQILLKSIIQ